MIRSLSHESVMEFLEPWQKHFLRLAVFGGLFEYDWETLGWTDQPDKKEDWMFLMGAPIYSRAQEILAAAYLPGVEPAKGIVNDILLLLGLLVPLHEVEGLSDYQRIALIPDAFWETYAGRTMVRVMLLADGDNMLGMAEAADRLGMKYNALYTLKNSRALPVFQDCSDFATTTLYVYLPIAKAVID